MATRNAQVAVGATALGCGRVSVGPAGMCQVRSLM